ncbi:hypothetical protein M23134_04783 [Microscilla marina ATCC 23134]|uniref:Uncharacterized protein n=2 Tax=Microscilla marina TaxID=1027 RepID=A1ZRU5_MICM2|nr:hypothetical protein M23134_04783 [Microscilla marina ATCC 23134]
MLAANPVGEVSQMRASLKEKAKEQKALVTNDLTKIKKDTGTVLLAAGTAFVTFQIIRALTKSKDEPVDEVDEPAPIICPPVEKKESWGKLVLMWVGREVVSYAAEKVRDVAHDYVQSLINKEKNVEEDTANTHSEKETRD